MKFTLVLIGLLVSGILSVSILALARARNLWSWLQLGGAACLAVVIFAHVAEEFHLFPGMAWGLPDSSGHYVDLTSAVLGSTLLTLGTCAGAILRRRETKSKMN
jgi:hypothetical protein